MKTKSKSSPKNKLRKLLDKLTHHKNKDLDSPWSDYDELSLLPLDELEKMVKDEAEKEAREIERATTQAKINALSEVVNLEPAESQNKLEPYVVDLSGNQTNNHLPLVTCYTRENEQQDPNLRITHYPPSNCLH